MYLEIDVMLSVIEANASVELIEASTSFVGSSSALHDTILGAHCERWEYSSTSNSDILPGCPANLRQSVSSDVVHAAQQIRHGPSNPGSFCE